MKRRTFIKKSLQTATALSLTTFPYSAVSFGTKKKYAQDIVTLGKTGIEVTRLALGTGTNGWGGSSNQTRKFGISRLGDFLRYAYDNGVSFWDSADQYGSHPHLREALKKVPREKVVILTKTHATTENEMQDDLDRFRREIGTDYIDIILLHCMEHDNWPVEKKAAMDVLSKARAEGIIRAHGVSCHTLGALKAAAKSEWVQVDLARYNPAGASMDAEVETVKKVLLEMKQAGKGIIGMKVFGAGRLRNRVDACLKFQLDAGFIDSFTIGHESVEQFDEVLKRIPALS